MSRQEKHKYAVYQAELLDSKVKNTNLASDFFFPSLMKHCKQLSIDCSLQSLMVETTVVSTFVETYNIHRIKRHLFKNKLFSLLHKIILKLKGIMLLQL